MTANIHKNKLYLRPKPKKDVKDGIIIIFNKPIREGGGLMATTNVQAGRKKYYLPELPNGVWIVSATVK